MEKNTGVYNICIYYGSEDKEKMNRTGKIIYKETQNGMHKEQHEDGFIHQEQPNEDYFESLNDYSDGTMCV